MTEIALESPTGEEVVPGLSRIRRDNDLTDHSKAVEEYKVRRLYYDGQQYEKENEDFARTAGYTAQGKRLPEHLRRHAYSSHIQEAIDILADLLSEGIVFDGPYAELLNSWWQQAEMDERGDDWFREALITGDVYGVPDWDVVGESMVVDVWEAESIWPVYDEQNWRRLDHWYRFGVVEDDQGEHEEVRIYVLEPTPMFIDISRMDEDGEGDLLVSLMENGQFVRELVEYVFVDEKLVSRNPMRLPMHPLVHARGDTRHKIRSRFGDSMITKKVMGSADRFNAISQLGFRVARQNSFATIAVVGDSAALGAGGRDESIAKDVADVLKFPGGTNVSSIILPTDPRMIESQQHLIERNLYREFGLTKTDLSEFGGLGTVSGYALEVVNRKDRATQNRIRKNAVAGIKNLANMMLDVYAIRTGESQNRPWWSINPLEMFPDREGIDVVIGSGDIVDATADRDDYAAGLVSRQYVLRRKGLGREDIEMIEEEIESAAVAASQREVEAAVETASRTAQFNRTSGTISESGTQTGSTQRSS